MRFIQNFETLYPNDSSRNPSSPKNKKQIELKNYKFKLYNYHPSLSNVSTTDRKNSEHK